MCLIQLLNLLTLPSILSGKWMVKDYLYQFVGKEDAVDYGGAFEQFGKMDDLLVKQPLTTDVLMLLHDLTQFENLMPRFSATVPPCWNEIQQEQQQRRHPQHLQQQGEAMQHTRTWRLQQDR